jgi:DNA-binding GntR family transcriptional regulator
VRDIFWGQAVLAGELAARAAKLITQEQLAEIADLMEAHRVAVASNDEPLYTRLGHRFHRAINIAARSPRLAILLGAMTKQLPNTLYGKMEGQIKGSLSYHPRIYKAIKDRDVEAARRLMHKHIVGGGEILVKHLEEQGVWHRGGGGPRRRASSTTAA